MNETATSPPEGGARTGDWMITATGRRFYPLDPRPEDISARDIIHHLARICRYGGAVGNWFSVAEHCCLLADYFAGTELAPWALLHDAAEAYIGDLIRPIKPSLPQFKAIETPLERMIWERFGLVGPLPPAVKAADVLIVADERRSLFLPEVLDRAGWQPRSLGLGLTLHQWERDQAAWEFGARFVRLFPKERLT